MSRNEPPRRRRIDRVTADDYLDDIDERSSDELRSMRDECREEEARLSYARRLLHGQLDIARAELVRRSSDTTEPLVSTLSEVLADRSGSPPTRSASNADVYLPGEAPTRRRGDQVLDDVPLGRLPDLSDDELSGVVTRLAQEEASISALRRAVLHHLDALQSALIAHYRDGGTSVDDVISSTLDDLA